MTRIAANPNVSAFMDMIAHSEIGDALLAASDDGYNVLVGSTASNPKLFDSYDTHPHVLNRALNSTAAGRYQIIFPTWSGCCKALGVSDFSPETQDEMCIKLLGDCGALAALCMGDFETAMKRASGEWASLPGSTAGQHVNAYRDLFDFYTNAGGTSACMRP
jgi:muramidase (phage lysozyme)